MKLKVIQEHKSVALPSSWYLFICDKSYSHCTKITFTNHTILHKLNVESSVQFNKKNYLMTNFSFSIISIGMKKSSDNITCPTNQWECSPIWLAERFPIWKRPIGWLARIEVSQNLKNDTQCWISHLNVTGFQALTILRNANSF